MQTIQMHREGLDISGHGNRGEVIDLADDFEMDEVNFEGAGPALCQTQPSHGQSIYLGQESNQGRLSRPEPSELANYDAFR